MTILEKMIADHHSIILDLLVDSNYCPCTFGFEDSCSDGKGVCKECWLKQCDETKHIVPSNIYDPVNRPSHYNDGKIEVIDFIEDKKLGFCLGNAVKYIARAGKKDPSKLTEDIKKAIWYLNRFLKEVEG